MLNIFLGVLTLAIICWTWAMLISEDQGESKLERIVCAFEKIADAAKLYAGMRR